MKLTLILVLGLSAFANCQFDKRVSNSQLKKIYLFNSTQRTFKYADKYCKQNGARLVQLHSKAEIEFINEHVTKDHFWLGVKTTSKTPPIEFEDGSTVNWIGYGDDQNLHDCTSIFIHNVNSDESYNRKLFTASCTSGSSTSVVCEAIVNFTTIRQIVNNRLEQQRQLIVTQNQTLTVQSQQINTMKNNITQQLADISKLNQESTNQKQTIQKLSNEVELMKKNITQQMIENKRILTESISSKHDEYFGLYSDLVANGHARRRR